MQSSEAQALTSPGVVAAFGFDEGIGTTARDSGPGALTASLAGQSWVAGRYGAALAFSGDLVAVPPAAALDLASGMTLEAWIYPTSPLPDDWEAVVVKEPSSGSGLRYGLWASSGAGTPEAIFFGSGLERNLQAGSRPPANTWTHLAATYDRASLRLYVNGVQVGSKAYTQSITTGTGALNIGGDVGEGGEFFQGRIDEVRIYGRALSAAEIQSDMATPISLSSPPPDAGAAGSGSGGAGAGGVGTGGSGTGGAGAGGSGAGGSGAVGVGTGGVGTGESGVGGMGIGGSGVGGTVVRGRFRKRGTGGSGAGGSGAGGSGAGGSGAGGSGAGGSGAAGSGAGGSGAGGSGVGGSGAGGSGTGGAGIGGATGGAPVYPLKVVAAKRYVVDQNGQPFLFVGDSPWSLIAAPTLADAKVYLDDRAARGFNTVLVSLVEHMYAPMAPRDANGDLPFTGTVGGQPDFATPNELYWAHVDAVLAAAGARGIQVLAFPAYLGYQGGSEGWYAALVANGTSRLTTYGTFLGNRYKNVPNLIWVAGGDYSPPDRTLTRAIHNAIRAVDANHLHSAHCAPEASATSVWGGESWLDINTVYTYNPVYQPMQSSWEQSGWKPTFLIESTYEGEHGISPPGVRIQAYQAVLSGAGVGQLFGNLPIWNFGSGWKMALASTGSRDMGRLAAFFSGRAWHLLSPDFSQTFLTAGASSGAAAASAALSSDSRLGIVYTPAVRDLTIALSRMSGPVTARWFDPTNG
ncbi:MAG TPA: DUF4038 domain-containing protein, partial [Polyangia bacterium]|nr:DUF4038 domain-containing protein [Polyangia bacterium]